MKKVLRFSYSSLLVLFLTCQPVAEKQSPSIDLFDYSNILVDPFFDRGSWLGLVLPETSLGIDAPYILSDSNGYKFKSQLIKINIDGEIENHYLPGRLVQVASTPSLEVTLTSVFRDHQVALIELRVVNLSDSLITENIEITYPDPDSVNQKMIVYDLKSADLMVRWSDGFSKRSGFLELDLELPPNTEKTAYITTRHRFKGEHPTSQVDFKAAPQVLKKNEKRWKQYLVPYEELSDPKRLLASKCIQTLVNNWRSPAGLLKFEGLFPSYAYRGFHGFWSWDSWKHAVALVTFEPELAKNQIRTMYHFQDNYGMIADVVYRTGDHNWRDTKPPLSAWAIWKVYQATKDKMFVEELLPKLIKYHNWWYENRDHNANGLCEYGSTDGTRIAAAWESGMDNAVRFDDAFMVKISDNAWSLNQESIDLNTYLYAEKLFISQLFDVVGNKDQKSSYEIEAQELKKKIGSHFYSEGAKYFFDVNTTTSSYVEVIGPEGWTPLWAKLATQEQAEGVKQKIMDESHFNTYVPFPTLSASHPKFNPENGYWRGPVWLDQAYFGLAGLKQYGYEMEYRLLKKKLMENAEEMFEKGGPIRENYDPRNGKGLNAKHFSWSAAHLLILLSEDL